tara:strand:+ start:261 stop:452 length:192 start_codon:yes stop_codon:yes gene_type:complete
MDWKYNLKCPCCDYEIGMMYAYDEANEFEDWYCTRPEEKDGSLMCGWSESIWVREITHLLEEF